MNARLAALLLPALIATGPGASAEEAPRRVSPRELAEADIGLWRAADAVIVGRLADVDKVEGRDALKLALETSETLRGERRARWTVLLRSPLHETTPLALRAEAMAARIGEEAVLAIESPPEARLTLCLDADATSDCVDAILAADARSGTPFAAARAPDGAFLHEAPQAPVCLGPLSTDGLGCSGGDAACVAFENVVSKRVYCEAGGLFRFRSDPIGAVMLRLLRRAE